MSLRPIFLTVQATYIKAPSKKHFYGFHLLMKCWSRKIWQRKFMAILISFKFSFSTMSGIYSRPGFHRIPACNFDKGIMRIRLVPFVCTYKRLFKLCGARLYWLRGYTESRLVFPSWTFGI